MQGPEHNLISAAVQLSFERGNLQNAILPTKKRGSRKEPRHEFTRKLRGFPITQQLLLCLEVHRP
jgi:hypothetical protein